MTRSERSAMLAVAAVTGALGLLLRWRAAGNDTGDIERLGSEELRVARSIASGRLEWFIEGGSGHRAGSTGALVHGGLIRVLGEPAAGTAMGIGVGVVAAALLLVMARRRLASPWPLIAAAVWSGGSAVWISSGARPSDPVVMTTLLGLTALALVDRRDSPRWWAVGLVLGLGWWTSGLMTAASVPALAVLLRRRIAPTAMGWLQLGVTAGVAGLPRIVDELRNGLPMIRAHGAWPDDVVEHLRTRPLEIVGAALGLTDRTGSWLVTGGRWVTLAVVIVLAATVVTVLARQPRSRAAVLLGAPAVLLLDLTGDGWGMPAHAMSLMLGPAAALAVVLALSAIPPSARPSAAIVALIATALIGTAGIVLGDRRGDQPPASAVNTASIEAAKRSEE